MIQGASPQDEEEIVKALDDPTIRILLPSGTPGYNQQLTALALIDLLCRLFPRIEVVCDPAATAHPALPPGAALLSERCRATREHGCTPLTPGEPAVTVAVGPTTEHADLHTDGAGWQAYLGTEPSQLPPGDATDIPVGPLIAATRAAAHSAGILLAVLLPSGGLPASDYFDAVTYTTTAVAQQTRQLPPVGELTALMVGAGSVGGAAVYLFARTPALTGRLAIVDPQRLEAHNFDRALLATAADVADEGPKVEVAATALAHLSLDFDPRQETISEYHATLERDTPLPLVLCAVDSADSRRAIQDCLPLDVINAACNRGEVMISGHRTDEGPCVCCLHMADVLNAQNIRARLIAAATGLNFEQVVVYLIQSPPLERQAIQFIEARTGRPPGSLDAYIGKTLNELSEGRLRYGELELRTGGGAQAAVAAPWVTALAGFLLAAEALKAAGGDAYEPYRLGPDRSPAGLHYREALYGSPADAIITSPARWPRAECLCRSPRRLRLLRERYGLPAPACKAQETDAR